MRILQVVQFFSPNHGGSAVVPYELSKHLRDAGHDVTVVTTDFEMNGDFINSLDGVEVLPFHCQMNIGGFLVSSSLIKYLWHHIDEFDVIHMHNFRTFQNIVCYYFAKKHDIPYILQAHGSVLRIIEKKAFKYLFDMFFGNNILKGAAKVVSVSNIEVSQYKQMGVSEERIVVIPNGIDLERFNNQPKKNTFRNKWDISENNIVLYLGRLHKRKGIDYLIKSFSLIRDEIKDIKLVLAGSDNEYRHEAELLITELNLTNYVKFTGYLGENDKIAAYVDATVLVYPATLEIFGLVPFEAVMCGTPVIVTNDCGCGELVQEAKCGYLVKYGSVEDFSEKMKYLLKNPEKRAEFVGNGIQYIQDNLSWKSIIIQMELLYESCTYKK